MVSKANVFMLQVVLKTAPASSGQKSTNSNKILNLNEVKSLMSFSFEKTLKDASYY